MFDNVRLFVDGKVGQTVLKEMIRTNINFIESIVVTSKLYEELDSDLKELVKIYIWPNFPKTNIETAAFLVWWPYILKKSQLSLLNNNVFNVHPSYLPFERGKDPNFWALKNQTPFGVTIHKITPSIDAGEIILQKKIDYSWIDNGATLYAKALTVSIELCLRFIQLLINKEPLQKTEIDTVNYKVNYRKDLEPASEIILENQYKARDLINLVRARTFDGHPGAWFIDEGKKYRVKISIEEDTD